MTEFGHHATRLKHGFVDSWGSGPFEITTRGKTFRFEDSDQFGPNPVKQNGDLTGEYYAEKSPFWRAWKLWRDQGRQVAEDGKTCVWDEERRSK